MNKLSYEAGAHAALRAFGIVKTAVPIGLGITKGPSFKRLLLQRMGLFGGAGGVVGGLRGAFSKDYEGNRAEGIFKGLAGGGLVGTAMGAGASLGEAGIAKLLSRGRTARDISSLLGEAQRAAAHGDEATLDTAIEFLNRAQRGQALKTTLFGGLPASLAAGLGAEHLLKNTPLSTIPQNRRA